MAITYADDAFDHDIPEEEIVWAIVHAEHRVESFGEGRGGRPAPTLFIGPSRFGTLEVLAQVTPPNHAHIFHAMPVREATKLAAGYNELQGQGSSPGQEPQEAAYDDDDT